jgi:hypothetical protein
MTNPRALLILRSRPKHFVGPQTTGLDGGWHTSVLAFTGTDEEALRKLHAYLDGLKNVTSLRIEVIDAIVPVIPEEPTLVFDPPPFEATP